jgi:flavorubredoxin
MEAINIKPDVYWVGGIDWNLRNFHGYQTPRGSTYNSYLIVDKKITLIDTVKHYLFEEMLERIKTVIDPKDISYVISNHVEMDHSGSLPQLLDIIPDATVITSTRGEKGLLKHYNHQWNTKVVQSGETLSIGKRTLSFVHIPMVHWPDSMVTYSKNDRLLFPNDAFGQHLATSERFDDQLPLGILQEEAAKYYANIVFPFGGQVQKALEGLNALDFDMIAPSHGIIWRSHCDEVIKLYKKWSTNTTDPKAVIIYDTMWGSTQKLAFALLEGLRSEGISVSVKHLQNNHISDIMKDILESKLVLLGSPTLNNGMLPTLGGFLTYLKGLRPLDRVGFIFGSFGWGGQAVSEIEKIVEGLGWDRPVSSVNINYIPSENDLKKMKDIGIQLAKYIRK